ncbi:hypothetical protein L21_1298 [Methanoculleus chikugoensis]|uniref:Uncharacterized protein n=1 Tax=Methanoculleus chikugoensis TaxID=118126 RepID=A0A1M4MKG4_9EURY|nr:hypothetical protein [Methanoculleus chikugoensis]MDD4567187.1 hypothetical protein [Methanoculleus chikugoensis]SCL75399.1 hypothetical protein L21_1298 [Methanoculleus chikugoensis]
MNATTCAKLLGFGLLTWVLSFLLAVPFYSPEGVALYDIFLIKSILLVVSAALGTFLILVSFRSVHARFVREGALLGGVWLLINWALDVVILRPLAGMDAGTYVAQIGLRYLTIPIIAVGIGYAAEQAVRGVGQPQVSHERIFWKSTLQRSSRARRSRP